MDDGRNIILPRETTSVSTVFGVQGGDGIMLDESSPTAIMILDESPTAIMILDQPRPQESVAIIN